MTEEAQSIQATTETALEVLRRELDARALVVVPKRDWEEILKFVPVNMKFKWALLP